MTTQTGSYLGKNKKKIICLIPARKGSKRIKNKNIYNFFGTPMLGLAIKTARKSALFDEIYVSTNSKKYKKIAENYGAITPFLRPSRISGDKATDRDVLEHFLNFYGKNNIKYLCYLYPCTPLLKANTLKKAYNLFIKKKTSKLLSVCKYVSKIERAIKLNKLNEVRYIYQKNMLRRSQDFSDSFYDAGQFYFYNFETNKKKTIAYTIFPMEGLDIDTREDLELAKKIFKANL